jgi:site-specific recombinase XerD
MGKQQTKHGGKQRPRVFLDRAYTEFLTARQAQNVTPRTLDFYEDKLHPFIAWAQTNGAATVDAVTAATVRAYLVHLQGRSLSPWTVHGAARAVRAFLRFCAAEGYIDAAPRFAMPKLPKKILPAFEPGDVRRLLDACELERDRALVLFMLDTGLRAAELTALNGSDVNERSGAVTVREGKGRKGRTVYLGAQARRALLKHWRERTPGPGAPVWASVTTGARLTESGLRQLLKRAGLRAGVNDCHPHTFRRTFALEALRGGMDIYTLARLMGHEDITVLKPYLALAERDLQAAHKAASPVDRLLK